ncbi:ion channel protein [Besnoitia besnoiti]|uniref:Ion channel protein n=1 Tax=Besnoitia besnoiti TaxID=94643 RepID=A0A2A9MBJ2_BESBE|nr:ion channel protein [Besnoitia besnoiti]PFH32987.1 ion channel protein [Besnoitia besnoiti]
MALQVETSYLLWRQLIRMSLDLAVVAVFTVCMVYIAFFENTWSTVSMRFVPSVLGWVVFFSSLFVFEPIYELYVGITAGQWPSWATRRVIGPGGQGELQLEDTDELRARQDGGAETEDEKLSEKRKSKLLRFNRLATDFKMRRRLKFGQGFVRASLVRLVYWHHLLRHNVHRLCSRPSFALATVVWNFAWSVSWCATLYRWRRETFDEPWNFHLIMTSEYAMQEFFLSAATLEFLMTFLQQTEVLPMLLWPSFWVEMVTLPPLNVLFYICFDPFFHMRRTAAELLLLTGCLRWIKTFFMTRFISTSVVWGNATKGHVVQLVLGIIFLLTSFASAMFTSDGINPDNIGDTERELYTLRELFNFWYFGVVTMSTVGYGDISPRTIWGQCFCIAFIVTSLIWVPSEFGRLIESFTSQRKVWGRLPLRIDHTSFVLLLGDVEPAQLSAFLQEVRLRRAMPPKIVVLSLRQFEDYRNQMEEAQSGQLRLCLVTGEAGIGGDPADLLMVQPHHSEGVFLLSSPSALTAYYDRQTLTRLLSLLRLKVDPQHVSVQLCTDVCANIIGSMGCLNYSILSDLKMGLIAKSICGHSGIIPLICNLSGSAYPDVPIGELTKQFGKETIPYLSEYVRGALHSLYAFRVPACMVGLPFEEVCLGLYYCANIICVGIQRDSSDLAPPIEETPCVCSGPTCFSSLRPLCKKMSPCAARRRRAAGNASPHSSCCRSRSDATVSVRLPPSAIINGSAPETVCGDGRPEEDPAGPNAGRTSLHVGFSPSFTWRAERLSASPVELRRRGSEASGSAPVSSTDAPGDASSSAAAAAEETRHRPPSLWRRVTHRDAPFGSGRWAPTRTIRGSRVGGASAASFGAPSRDELHDKQRSADYGPSYSRIQSPLSSQEIAFWVNPAGKNYRLHSGDKCVIIAPSVGAAEFLASATVVPWSQVLSSPLGRFVDLIATQPARAAVQAAGQAVAFAADAKEVVNVAITATKDVVGTVAKVGSDEKGSSASGFFTGDELAVKHEGTLKTNASGRPAKARKNRRPGNSSAEQQSPVYGLTRPDPKSTRSPGGPLETGGATAVGDKPQRSSSRRLGPRTSGLVQESQPLGGLQRISSIPETDERRRTLSGREMRTHAATESIDMAQRGLAEERARRDHDWDAGTGSGGGASRPSRDRVQSNKGPKQFSESARPSMAPAAFPSEAAPAAPGLGDARSSRASSRERSTEERISLPSPGGDVRYAAGPSPGSPASASLRAVDGDSGSSRAPDSPQSAPAMRSCLRRPQAPPAQETCAPPAGSVNTLSLAEIPCSPSCSSESSSRRASLGVSSTASQEDGSARAARRGASVQPASSLAQAGPCPLRDRSASAGPPGPPFLAPPADEETRRTHGVAPHSGSAGAGSQGQSPFQLSPLNQPAKGDSEPVKMSPPGSEQRHPCRVAALDLQSIGTVWAQAQAGDNYAEATLRAVKAFLAEREREKDGLQHWQSWASIPAAIPTPLPLREGRTAEGNVSAAAGASAVFRKLFTTSVAGHEYHKVPSWNDELDEEAVIPVVHVGDEADFDSDAHSLDLQSTGPAQVAEEAIPQAPAHAELESARPSERVDAGASARALDDGKLGRGESAGEALPHLSDRGDLPGAHDERDGHEPPPVGPALGDADEPSSDESDMLAAEPRVALSHDVFATSYLEARRLVFAVRDNPLILICGWPKYLGRLLMKIEAIGGWNVIILTAEAPPPWADLRYVLPFRRFTAIIRARPLSEVNLVRAGVLDAKRFFIFPLGLDSTASASDESIAQQDDRNVILVYLQIKNLLLQKADMLARVRPGSMRHLQPLQYRANTALPSSIALSAAQALLGYMHQASAKSTDSRDSSPCRRPFPRPVAELHHEIHRALLQRQAVHGRSPLPASDDEASEQSFASSWLASRGSDRGDTPRAASPPTPDCPGVELAGVAGGRSELEAAPAATDASSGSACAWALRSPRPRLFSRAEEQCALPASPKADSQTPARSSSSCSRGARAPESGGESDGEVRGAPTAGFERPHGPAAIQFAPGPKTPDSRAEGTPAFGLTRQERGPESVASEPTRGKKTPAVVKGAARRNACVSGGGRETEALMLELHDQNNWRFVNDVEWIDRNVKDYPCYSSATYLLSPEYINGNLFADRMNFAVLTQHPAISPHSITPQFLSELIGYAFTGNWPGIELEDIPPTSLEDGLTFGDLFRTLLLDSKKIAVGLYRCGVGSLRNYVYTCPSHKCILQPTDRVFVIPMGIPRPRLSPEKVIRRVNAYLAKQVGV